MRVVRCRLFVVWCLVLDVGPCVNRPLVICDWSLVTGNWCLAIGVLVFGGSCLLCVV